MADQRVHRLRAEHLRVLADRRCGTREIRRIGEGFLARALPKAEWTHEAHLSTTAWLILECPDIQPERDLPDLIRRYNESVGGVNDATQGYHETITQLYVRGVRLSLARNGGAGGLADRVIRLSDGLIASVEENDHKIPARDIRW